MKTQKYLLVLVGAASMSSAAYSMNMDLEQIKENAVKTATEVAKFSEALANNDFGAVKSYLAKNNGYLFTPAALEAIVKALEQAQSFVHSKLAMIPLDNIKNAGVSGKIVAGLEAAIDASGKSFDFQPMVDYLNQIKLSPENFIKFVDLLKAKASQLDLSQVKTALNNVQTHKTVFENAINALSTVNVDATVKKAIKLVKQWWEATQGHNDQMSKWWDAPSKDDSEMTNGEVIFAELGATATKLQKVAPKFAEALAASAELAVSVADLAKQVVSVYGPVLADAVPAREKAQINKAVALVKDRFGDVKEKVSPVINKVKSVVSSLR